MSNALNLHESKEISSVENEKEKTYSLVEAEKEEGLEVVIADTVANPGTVVVHFGNANVADTAVVCPLWLPVAASLAVHVLLRRSCLWDNFGSLECSHTVGKQCHGHQEIEQDFHQFAVDLVGHPLVHFVVHQVYRHRIENDDDKAHDKDEEARNHVVSEKTAKQAVTEHTHQYVVRLISFLVIGPGFFLQGFLNQNNNNKKFN